MTRRPIARAVAVSVATAAILCASTAAVDASGPATAKRRVLQSVYDDLVRAIGDGRTPPRLRLSPLDEPTEGGAVWLDAQTSTLVFEERAYNALVSNDDSLDAIAFVLGHEMAHFYKDHGWTGDFARQVRDLAVGRQLKGQAASGRRSVGIETAADYFSGFYGRMAGYRPLDAAAGALERIYDEYGLGQPMPGYPTLTERQEIADRTARQLARLVPVFDGGSWLLLTGHPFEASACFDYIARSFPSREILNNAGVARSRAAIALFEPGELPFPYPLELDARTRLRETDRADRYEWVGDADERRRLLLEAARHDFESAQRRDPAYLPALVNLAVVADLQGEHDEAVFLAQRAVRAAAAAGDSAAAARATLVQAIATVRLDDLETARQLLAAARTHGGPLVDLALAVLDGGSPPASPVIPSPRGGELAGAADYDDAVDQPDLVVTVPPLLDEESELTFYVHTAGGRSRLVIDTGYRTFSFLRTADEAARSERGVHVGTPLADLTGAYGEPTHVIPSGHQTHLVYGSAGIVFGLENGAVTDWLTYVVE